MTVMQAVETRISRRSFTNNPIPPALVAQLDENIAVVNKLGGLSIRFVQDGSGAFSRISHTYGLLTGVKSVISLAGPAEDPFLHEKLGYFGELLVLSATRMGLATCWVGGSFDKEYPLCQLHPSEKQVCVVAVGFAPEELTAREKIVRKALHRANKPMEALYEADEPPPEWFMAGIYAVSKAPTARNLHPTRFIWKENSVFVQNEVRFSYQKIDLGIVKAHFSLGAGGRFEPGEGSVFIKENHQLAAWPFD
jgi:hypothetical protein